MNLVSCRNCGVVLDKNMLHFPEDIWGYNGELDEDLGSYSYETGRMVPYVKCPVCNEKVLDE